MRIKEVPSQKILHQSLDYNLETGIFIWKYRYDQPAWWNGKFAGKLAGSKREKGIVILVNNKPYYAHRLAWVYIYGDTLNTKTQVDHKNNNSHDNKIKNLRLATHGQNCTNCRARKWRKLPKGVYEYNDSGKFRAAIGIDKKIFELGVYNAPEEAHAAYLKEAIKYKGEFARSA